MSSIRTHKDGKRDPEREAMELDAFITRDAGLAKAARALSVAGEQQLFAGSYSVEEQARDWRGFYDRAAKEWRRVFGYTPLPRARQICAYSRAIAERQSLRARAMANG